MAKILIIGGGFSGLSAAARLCKFGLGMDTTLVDKKETTDFLPMLPDCIGRGVDPEFLSYSLADIAKKNGFRFIRDEIISLDLQKQVVFSKTQTMEYDYLLIASGSETNFYNNTAIQEHALTLDSAEDAKKILRTLSQNKFDNFIICGGGYTGIEVASNLRVYLDKSGREASIIIAERAPAILGPLPEWMKNYVAINLGELKIEVILNTSIEEISGQRVILSGGKIFERALVIWTAGVKTAAFIQGLRLEKNPQGRIKVDECLRIDNHCFAAGDAAYFTFGPGSLRMAVQFAITQGECAAVNIRNSIRGARLKRYLPRDLGYIIPMANNRSCGNVLGFNLKGSLPTLLHFIMCIYRSYGIKNKTNITRRIIRV